MGLPPIRHGGPKKGAHAEPEVMLRRRETNQDDARLTSSSRPRNTSAKKQPLRWLVAMRFGEDEAGSTILPSATRHRTGWQKEA